ncbi:MAG TPA: hypothetical protein VFR70_05150 [Flavobacterium sp.]|nr:hypothetical protein [Flavobacterium sp.]
MAKAVLSFFILFYLAGLAQAPALNPVYSGSSSFEIGQFLGEDNLGGRYALNENEFRKSYGGRVLFYKNIALGKIQRADLQNPLQLVLFYKQFTAAVLLDSQLNETAKINFSELDEPLNPEAVSLASQNRLWVYDMLSQKLGLFDIAKKSFHAITRPLAQPIIYYQSDYNYFYWINAKRQLYASNLFGKISFLGLVPDFEEVQLVGVSKVLGKKDGRLFLYNLETDAMIPIGLNEKSFAGFFYREQILSIFTQQEIHYYKISLE